MIISGSTRGVSWKVTFPTAANSGKCKVELQRNTTNAESESNKELKGGDPVLEALSALFAETWSTCRAENHKDFTDEKEEKVYNKMIQHVTEILIP